MLALRNAVELLVLAIWLLMAGRVLISWIDPMGRNDLSVFLYRTTEPMLAPIRRFLPPTGMLDLSPLIFLIVLGVVVRALGF